MRLRVAASILAAALAGGCAAPISPTPSPRPPASASPAPTNLDAQRISGRIAWSVAGPDGSDDVVTLELPAVAGAEPLRIAGSAEKEFDPDLSPDGRFVAYRSNPDPATDAADIWVIEVEGSVATNLTADPRLDNWSPAWSPDGTRIAFASTRNGGPMSIWTMDVKGGSLARVTRTHGEYPDWSPDGSRIVYAAPAGGGSNGPYDLWVADLMGAREAQRITSWAGTDFAPAWSPDGEWIAYQSDISGRFELWLIRPDGSDAHAVTPNEDGVWPAWSPDGLLAWSGPRGVVVADLETNASLVLPNPSGADFLSWSR
jgi:Tol biopolymer transport system component